MSDGRKMTLRIEYPAPWAYKIIGPDADAMKQAVADMIRDQQYTLTVSRESETAKYICLNLELTVESESHRLALYGALKANPCIKIVL